MRARTVWALPQTGCLKPCCRGDTVMVTAPVLPLSVTRGDTRCSGLHWARVSQGIHVCLCELRIGILCFSSYMHLINHSFSENHIFLLIMCVCVCACTEGMSLDSARCYPSCCLNVLHSHRQLLHGAPGPRVCTRTTYCTYSNGPFSLMVLKASPGGDEYPMRKEGLGAVKVYSR